MYLIQKTLAATQTLGELLGKANPTANLGTILDFLKSLISILLAFAGAVGVVMLLYASLLYVTSYGDDSKAETAKKTIFWSIVGLVVIALVYVITGFIYGYIKNTPR